MTDGSSEQPLVTVVTPVYNGAKYVAETMQSVLDQSYSHIEHIVLDDGSTDETPSILKRFAKKYPERIKVHRHANMGQTATVNKGFLLSKGEIIGWLNADDRYKPHAVEEAVQMIMEPRERHVVFGGAEYIDEAGRVTGNYPASEANLESLIFGTWSPLIHCSLFVHGSVLFQVGLLDPNLYYAMDLDWLIRIATVYKIHQKAGAIWSEHRRHPETKTDNPAAKYRSALDYLYLYSKVLTNPELSDSLRGRRSEIHALAYWHSAVRFNAGGHKRPAIKHMLHSLLLGPPYRRIDGLKLLVKWVLDLK